MFLLVMRWRFGWLAMNGTTNIADESADTSGESRAVPLPRVLGFPVKHVMNYLRDV
jgi:hypothetical protein